LAHAVLAVFAVALLIKAANVQLVQGTRWRARAARQQTAERVVPAPRGDILDATRRVLAQSRETVRLEIAPREVNEPRKLRTALTRLHVEPAIVARALDTSGKYLTVPGRFLAVDAAPAMAMRGVHSFASLARSYAISAGAEGLLGHVDADNKPLDGIELALDSILHGQTGTATIVRDSHGQGRESPIEPGTAPVKGSTIVLTINADLQEIAEKALADAVARMGAEGGDIVVLDPRTGAIRAMASRRLDPRQTSATVLTEPFEPGSTAKPFMAAGLIDRGRVSDKDSVDTGNGVYEINNREIHDEHHVGRAPLADVIRWSSNIGIVKFSQRLNEREEFETLRDFGFGTTTGVPYPTESGGLRRWRWATSSRSLRCSSRRRTRSSPTAGSSSSRLWSTRSSGPMARCAITTCRESSDAWSHRRRPTRSGTCCSTSSTKAPRSRPRSTTIYWPARRERRAGRSTDTTSPADTTRTSSACFRATIRST
jgi:cell division protein FtsI (penicillin-binding protein 3)